MEYETTRAKPWESSSVSDEFGAPKLVGLDFGSFLIMVLRGSVLGIGLKERGTRVLVVCADGTAGSRKMVGEHDGAEEILLISG